MASIPMLMHSLSAAREHGGLCPYCAKPFVNDSPLWRPTRDHVRPKRAGMSTIKIIVCYRCNHDKGGLFLVEWIERLSAVNDKRARLVAIVAEMYPRLSVDSGLRVAERLAYFYREPLKDAGLQRTPTEERAAKATIGRFAPWIKCERCGRFFPNDKAIGQHRSARHPGLSEVAIQSMSLG